MVETFDRYLEEANSLLEKTLYGDAYESDSEVPEAYERSAPSMRRNQVSRPL